MNPSNIIAAIADAVTVGEKSAAEAWAELKEAESALKDAMESIREPAAAEIAKWGKEGYSHNGVRYGLKNGPGRWDYGNIPEWVRAKENMKAVEELAKAAWQMKQKGRMVVEEGEVMEAATYTEGGTIISKMK